MKQFLRHTLVGLFCYLVFPTISSAAVWHRIEVFGKVENFNDSYVTLKGQGKSFKVRQKDIVDKPELKTGQWIRLTLEIDPTLPLAR